MNTSGNASWFGETHHLSDEGVALYVDALNLDRTDRLPPAILEHVHQCAECKQEITGLFALVAQNGPANTGTHPYLDRGRTDRRILYRMAAGLAVVIGLGALTYTLFLRGPERSQPPAAITQSHPDTTASPIRNTPGPPAPLHEMLAARFEPSPELEDLVHSTVRSAGTTIDAPANGTTLRPGTRFTWTTTARPPFMVTVLDNQRRTIQTAQVATTFFTMKDTLAPGLYYWKLTAEGDLLHVGSFVVR